jgi:hypothetical protein
VKIDYAVKSIVLMLSHHPLAEGPKVIAEMD